MTPNPKSAPQDVVDTSVEKPDVPAKGSNQQEAITWFWNVILIGDILGNHDAAQYPVNA